MKNQKTRIYINKSISLNLIIYIKDKQHHFLKNVLRIKINDEISVFDGKTGEWKAKIISISRDNTAVRVFENIKKMEKSSDLWLVFSPIKQNRMSIAIQKATEIGVNKIIPCNTNYTNIKNINLKNLYQNAIEASEQSQRLDIPIIEREVDLKSLLQNWPNDRKLIYCDEKIKTGKLMIETIINIKNNAKKWAVIIGPEGGFSDKERELILNNNNTVPISLGNTILRSDTAITVALYCLKEITA
ncbi:MAG: Ribosomal RNA small subunit methyltransferase E [Alphaproteobacteria bacterium MarineAlpha5_Bin5]|nr:MAG: Ribosomal RNA small subunit methyltransferase E [Alphaproteobacteria bacterium MarineAlpha5_Bin5]PPR51686.1 MAG: Ribosomal RNA small subunit methyltransferase E [Alphaproteobacteria bacterium MarineAlpha5_Bin4]|tara:strand:+ start:5836 stop:6567 length:732 start_codon:yes stop_codon:yes gene_type:complete